MWGIFFRSTEIKNDIKTQRNTRDVSVEFLKTLFWLSMLAQLFSNTSCLKTPLLKKKVWKRLEGWIDGNTYGRINKWWMSPKKHKSSDSVKKTDVVVDRLEIFQRLDESLSSLLSLFIVPGVKQSQKKPMNCEALHGSFSNNITSTTSC